MPMCQLLCSIIAKPIGALAYYAYWHIILHKSLKKKRESLFFSQSFFYFTEKHYLCALKMTITLFLPNSKRYNN